MSDLMENNLLNATMLMKNHGLKCTKKREKILSYLINENRYVAALDVFEYMNQLYPGMSYDTVYRNLRDFSELNILEETTILGEKKYRFHCHLNKESGHHHHFICTECGATREINLCPMDFFEEQLPGCQIESHRFEILGKCEQCLKKISIDS